MEKQIFTKEDLKAYAKGTTRESGKITLPAGTYDVSHLELREEEIAGEKRKWVDIHLVNVDSKSKSGAVPASRTASAGFSEIPIEGRVSKKWYFPGKPIGSIYEGDLADMLVEIQGKRITVEVVEGKNPNFPLASFENKAAAEKAAKDGGGFAARNYYKITKIAQVA